MDGWIYICVRCEGACACGRIYATSQLQRHVHGEEIDPNQLITRHLGNVI